MESPYTVAAAVLAAVHDRLVECEADPVSTQYVAVGQAVWDDPCGQLVVAVERTFRTVDPFPTEAVSDAVCAGNPIGVDVVVLLVRCMPVIDDAGRAPAPSVLDATSASIYRDAAIVWNVLAGFDLLGDDGFGEPEWERGNLAQTFTGADGGAIGIESRVTLGVPAHLWCQECPPPVEVPGGDV